ncbi:Yip1 family protein [Mangrovibacterium diazotrophicum]|uniref:Yip1-like protein n=1 Tax=Mangrovibacterium diazotrophicum TaxID=1261403 RepID=A0A419VWB3_9BACT|nr:Yip1 family protein [Mangrovibacterium diazotrophicum]RKD86435.1 Yip1-like protein [Mangrovibacterium diazotrophicum]
MDFKAQFNWLFQESWTLLGEPKKFWKKKLAEGFSQSIVVTFFIPLVVLAGVAILLGEIFWNEELLWSYAIFKSLREIFSYLVQYFITALVMIRLLENFKGTSNKTVLYNVLAYSLLPFIIASIVTGLFPGLYVLGIIGLYGFYLLVLGIQTCLEIPKENQSRFIILSILLIVFIFGTVNVISWKILQSIFPYGA